MSWVVHLIENTVTFSNEETETIQNQLQELDNYLFEKDWCGASKGKLLFQEDHMEGIDWLSEYPESIDILVAHQAQGDVCFGALEGDNRGSFWGYRFRPGECVRLSGRILWTEVEA